MRKPVLIYANNKGADQPAHPRSLISTFVVRCLDSIIPILAKSKKLSLKLVSVVEQAGLSFIWSQIPEDRFSPDVAQMRKAVPGKNTGNRIRKLVRRSEFPHQLRKLRKT